MTLSCDSSTGIGPANRAQFRTVRVGSELLGVYEVSFLCLLSFRMVRAGANNLGCHKGYASACLHHRGGRS